MGQASSSIPPSANSPNPSTPANSSRNSKPANSVVPSMQSGGRKNRSTAYRSATKRSARKNRKTRRNRH